MKLNRYPKEEMLGNPEYFCGRKKELDFFLKWAAGIPEKSSKSRALLATKKMGKTAILERIYNILFEKRTEPGPKVIPFFFKGPEKIVRQSLFAEQFYLSFLSQFLAYKLDQPLWISDPLSLSQVKRVVQENSMDWLLPNLEAYEELKEGKMEDLLWEHACRAPHRIASNSGEFFLQIIDEFQYFNQNIIWDEGPPLTVKLAGATMNWRNLK